MFPPKRVMAEEKPNLFEYLEKYFGSAGGLDAAIVLDTSAIIDLESAYCRQVKYGRRRAHEFLDHLAGLPAGERRIFIPERVKEEVETHHFYHVINGCREISTATAGRVKDYSSSDIHADNFARQNNVSDFVRYYTRLLYWESISGKKAERDPIAGTDWEVIDLGLNLGVFTAELSARKELRTGKQEKEERGGSDEKEEKAVGEKDSKKEEEKGSTSGESNTSRGYKVAVLSGDKHILWALEKISDYPWGIGVVNYVRAIDTRRYQLKIS